MWKTGNQVTSQFNRKDRKSEVVKEKKRRLQGKIRSREGKDEKEKRRFSPKRVGTLQRLQWRELGSRFQTQGREIGFSVPNQSVE